MRSRLARSLVLLAAVSCSEERASTPGNNTGNDSGGRDAGTSTGGDGGTVAAGAGDTALRAGDIDGAFTAYRASSNAFGTCLTRTLKLASGPAASAVLQRFGLQPVPIADIAGPRGIMVRRAEMWRGDGEVTATPGGRATYGRARARGASITARDYPTGDRLSVYFFSAALPAAGTRIALPFDCTSGNPMGAREVSITWSTGGGFCNLAQSQAAGAACDADGGTIEATQIGARAGDAWRVKLENVLADCPAPNNTTTKVRLTGELRASYTPDLDVRGMHPLLADVFDGGFDPAPYVSALAAGTRLDALVRLLQPMVAELDTAAEECARAGQGSGVVFTAPGTLWGGVDLPITAADAKMAAGLLGAASTAIQIALAYDHPLELASMCTATECIDDRTLVDRLNSSVPAYANRPLATARTTFDRALGIFIAGIDAAGPNGVVPKDNTTTAGLAVWRSWLSAIQSSLQGGGVAFPEVSPVVRIDLRGAFTAPPDFSRAMTDPLVYDTRIRWVEAFGQETVDRYLDLEWGSSYDSPNEARDPAEAFSERLEKAGMVLDD